MRRSPQRPVLAVSLAALVLVLSLALASSRAVTGAGLSGSPFAPTPNQRLDFPEFRAPDSDALDASICLHVTRNR